MRIAVLRYNEDQDYHIALDPRNCGLNLAFRRDDLNTLGKDEYTICGCIVEIKELLPYIQIPRGITILIEKIPIEEVEDAGSDQQGG